MTTAILSALAEEQQGLIELLREPRRVARAGREFWLGELHGTPVVLALSRIGKVAAATTTTTLIEAFGVQRLIFTGVAGGIGPGVQVGDVVVASEFVQHDMDASPLFPRYQIPLYDRERFACDIALGEALLAASRASLESLALPATVHHGLIASGDRFVSAAEEARALHAALSNAGHAPLAVEMEGAAVAQVCHDYAIPYAAVRTISDRADDSAHVDFPQFVTEVASRYALAIIDEFVRELNKSSARGV
ncbi:5'-methylthioadenosine/adenosylhomocysteine nucleosidase [Rhodoferax sp. BAB1]|uniref:5'-methylthioadenosine/adenosylhomocysteine nucleosidase n=1 Tax=Rhodoferax sp. BAB1 TaxID=2741720 RepID=UPI0015764BF0|nr:5'-methylthioadenosine/adenosylhomocysteine nucleosidase [Rhodoferax sp. BAB1]QKO23971.1 5'-methylthioadenosine/adenosylhomocysteine nucleosidase [Rhodoferax sp. BAB1]